MRPESLFINDHVAEHSESDHDDMFERTRAAHILDSEEIIKCKVCGESETVKVA